MKLALTLPGSSQIPQPSGLNPNFKDLASFISPLLNIIFYASLFLAFFWLVWGALAYIMAQGKKEDLAKARARITWALIGLFVILLAFFITQFVSEIFKDKNILKGGLPF